VTQHKAEGRQRSLEHGPHVSGAVEVDLSAYVTPCGYLHEIDAPYAAWSALPDLSPRCSVRLWLEAASCVPQSVLEAPLAEVPRLGQVEVIGSRHEAVDVVVKALRHAAPHRLRRVS
jgi:hypothetical protein